MENPILETKNLSKSYGKLKAVNQLTIQLEAGRVYGILGPNGSGKTTTLAMLTDAVRPTAGSFSWFGQKSGSNQRRKIGVMLEKPNFYEYMSALDNLKIVADIRGVEHSAIDEVLHQVGLYERRKSRFSTFSLGMKQRLAIGSALIGNPQVLILDEPTNGLDPEGIAEVRSLIRNLASDNKTIILASHLLDEVQKVCTHMIVLKKGEMVYNGTVNGLEKPKNKIALQADDMPMLISLLKQNSQFSNFEENGGFVYLQAEKETKSSEINSYLHQNGLVLSHLSYVKERLEDTIFELLNETR